VTGHRSCSVNEKTTLWTVLRAHKVLSPKCLSQSNVTRQSVSLSAERRLL
jgi:hypothetical protein